MELTPFKKNLQAHFESIAPKRRAWKNSNAYYYQLQTGYYRFLVPKGKRVLELGCGTGELLAALEPSYGLGIDLSSSMIELAQEAFPTMDFRQADAEAPSTWGEVEGPFDFIILSDLVGHLEDVQATLERLHPYCAPFTRIIISHYNQLWQPPLKFADRMGWKTPTMPDNWLSMADLENLFALADFEAVKMDRRVLGPKKIPVLHGLLEFVGCLPLLNALCLSTYVVARAKLPTPAPEEKSVTVLIPCRNERGNIEPAIDRLPQLGSHTEVIFVDGHSTDGTVEEIQRVMALHPDKDIKLLKQDGKGKGDAVRKGFSQATGDILMILDADLTVPPEDLPKFHQAIVTDKGEFINGTRLVYPMEDEAMRFLNMLGNKFFSLVFSWLLNQRIKDTLCGTKVLSRKHYEMLAANRSYFGDFDPFGDFDLLFGASKLNLKIVEVPIRYRARQYGETQISRFRHGWLLLKMSLFAVRKLKLIQPNSKKQ